MLAIDQAMIDRVLEREGGYVDHPLDKGGPTNKGITLMTLTEWLGHPPTLADLRDILPETARAIYFEKFMLDPGISAISDDNIREIVFDAAVNSGPVNAIKILQRALNTDLSEHLTVDGVLGPKTLEVVNDLHVEYAMKFCLALCAQRLRFYANIIRVNPQQAVFAGGWINRIAGLMEDL